MNAHSDSFPGEPGTSVPEPAPELKPEPGSARPRLTSCLIGIANQAWFASYEPFPVDCLPLPVREFALAQARADDCDPAAIALPVLSALASSIGCTRRIRLRQSWTEPAVLWTALVTEPGNRTRPPLDAATEPLRELQEQALRQQRQGWAKYEQQMARYRIAKRRYVGFGPAPRQPAAPACDRPVVNTATIRSLLPLLQRQSRGVLVCVEQIGDWLFRAQRGADRADWVHLHSGRTMTLDSLSGAALPVVVPHPSVSVTGTIPAAVLSQRLRKTTPPCALTARLLLAYPPSQPRVWTDDDVPDAVADGYRSVLTTLRSLSFENSPAAETGNDTASAPKSNTANTTANNTNTETASGEDEDADLERQPVLVGMSADAKRCFGQFVGRFTLEMIDADAALAAALMNLEGAAARLALVIHLARWAAGEQVDPRVCDGDSLQRGIRLARWFAAETRRIHALFLETDAEVEQRLLIEWLHRRGGGATARDLCRSNGRKYPTTELAVAALDRLVGDGVGVWVEIPARERGGPPYRVLSLEAVPSDTPAPEPTVGLGQEFLELQRFLERELAAAREREMRSAGIAGGKSPEPGEPGNSQPPTERQAGFCRTGGNAGGSKRRRQKNRRNRNRMTGRAR